MVGRITGPEVRTQALFRDRFVGVFRLAHTLSRGKMMPARYAGGRHISISRRGLEKGPIDEALKPLALARASDLVATVPERQTGILRDCMHSFPLPYPRRRSPSPCSGIRASMPIQPIAGCAVWLWIPVPRAAEGHRCPADSWTL